MSYRRNENSMNKNKEKNLLSREMLMKKKKRKTITNAFLYMTGSQLKKK